MSSLPNRVTTSFCTLVYMKRMLRELAVSQLRPEASQQMKDRGRKLYAASKALECMIDEAAMNSGAGYDQEEVEYGNER